MMIHDSALGRFYNTGDAFGDRMYAPTFVGEYAPKAIQRARMRPTGLGEAEVAPTGPDKGVEDLSPGQLAGITAGIGIVGIALGAASAWFGYKSHTKLYRAMAKSSVKDHGGYKFLYYGGGVGNGLLAFNKPLWVIPNLAVYFVARSMEKK